jgi:acyl-homoserine lactone acylase PvdQ
MNYIENWDVSEIKGQSVLYNDLEIRLLIDVDEAKADYKKSSLVKKLNSYADGINFYLINILK